MLIIKAHSIPFSYSQERRKYKEKFCIITVLIVAENVFPLISECEIVFITMIVMLLLLHFEQNLESKDVLNK